MTGKELIAEWERRQCAGHYQSYEQSMADMAKMIDALLPAYRAPEPDDKWDYREEQTRLREQGWDAYNCDMVDEFPTW